MTVKTTRDALAAAFAEADGDETEPEASAEGGAAAEPVEGAEPAPAETAAAAEPDGGEPAEPEEGEEPPRGQKRGADGKFVAADAEEPQAKPKPVAQAKPDAAAAAAASQQPALKPPADWRPAAREEFAKLPRIVQEEAVRLHLEAKKILQDSAQARQIAGEFQRSVQPYEHLLRASGRSAMDGVGYLLQTYAHLHTAPLPQRAQILGGLVRDFLGVDEGAINLLAQTLEGKAPQGGGAGGAPGIRPEQIPQLVRQEAQRMAAETQHQAEMKAVSDFEASAPEFLNDVVQEVKAIVTIEKQQGKPITTELLKAAYDKALRLNPQTAAILKQRDDAASAKTKAAEAVKKKAAASGLKNEPPGPRGSAANGKAKSTRDELARQFAKADGSSRV